MGVVMYTSVGGLKVGLNALHKSTLMFNIRIPRMPSCLLLKLLTCLKDLDLVRLVPLY